MDITIPTNAPASREPAGPVFLARQPWLYGSMRWRTAGGHAGQLSSYGPGLEWISWAIVIDGNGGWGARAAGFTLTFSFRVATADHAKTPE